LSPQPLNSSVAITPTARAYFALRAEAMPGV
jgi:hypothetical protein